MIEFVPFQDDAGVLAARPSPDSAASFCRLRVSMIRERRHADLADEGSAFLRQPGKFSLEVMANKTKYTIDELVALLAGFSVTDLADLSAIVSASPDTATVGVWSKTSVGGGVFSIRRRLPGERNGQTIAPKHMIISALEELKIRQAGAAAQFESSRGSPHEESLSAVVPREVPITEDRTADAVSITNNTNGRGRTPGLKLVVAMVVTATAALFFFGREIPALTRGGTADQFEGQAKTPASKGEVSSIRLLPQPPDPEAAQVAPQIEPSSILKAPHPAPSEGHDAIDLLPNVRREAPSVVVTAPSWAEGNLTVLFFVLAAEAHAPIRRIDYPNAFGTPDALCAEGELGPAIATSTDTSVISSLFELPSWSKEVREMFAKYTGRKMALVRLSDGRLALGFLSCEAPALLFDAFSAEAMPLTKPYFYRLDCSVEVRGENVWLFARKAP